MLAKLKIHNFAIIDNLSLTLKNGLNTLSGETGAGKSIIINAINLILGARSSADMIRTDCNAASVEGHFLFPANLELAQLLAKLNIPSDRELSIKRTIFREGRNTIHINGSPSTLQNLSRLGRYMVSISGQHSHQDLLKPDHYLYLLDTFSGLEEDRDRFSGEFEQYQQLKARIRDAEKRIDENQERRELSAFQLQEIEDVDPKPLEDEVLNEEKVRLQHAEDLVEIARTEYETLYERSDAVLSILSRCGKRIAKGAQLDKRLLPISDTLSAIEANIEDVSFALRDFQETVLIDPKRLAAVSDRIDALNRLKRKYGGTIEGVLQSREKLASRFDNLAGEKGALANLLEQRTVLETKLIKQAEHLSLKRHAGAKGFKTAIETELRQLHMKDTCFEAIFEEAPQKPGDAKENRLKTLGPHGFDQVSFMLSTNPGEALKPISAIVSGGELSRIMLSIKTILAKNADVETIVFDEVDAGISGATAEVVGEKLSALASFHQILCITHLPQIACQGDSHFLVKKEVANGRTRTTITELTPEGRVSEIARLLGGRKTTSHATAHAKAMLGENASSVQ
jgi:DNA repair protein RecN (Recombination protein N)